MFCKNCGKQIGDDVKFCRYCGNVTPGEIPGEVPMEQTMPLWDSGGENAAFAPAASPNNRVCPNCGGVNVEHAQFCKHCGSGFGSAPSNTAPPFASSPAPAPTTPAKNNTVLIVALVAAIVVALALAAVAAIRLDWFSFLSSRVDPSVEPVETVETSPDIVPIPPSESEVDLRESINTYLSGINRSYDVSVAVYDNRTDSIYLGGASNAVHPAWGFYVPVYLAAGDYYSIDAVTRENIMSSDVGVCNQAGNAAIRAIGGPSAVTSHLSSRYNASATSYGRYFADLNATGENYTNVKEASEFLAILNDRNEYTKLSYNPSGFGITVPASATYYCQIGTEDKAKLDKLNFFAVVKGPNTDYCVAIMSQSGAGKTSISGLLHVIQDEMERMYA